jgi:hypothetical protein
MPAWITLVVALVVGLLGAALDRRAAQEPTLEAQRRPQLKGRLQTHIKRHKGKLLSATLLAIMSLAAGCRSQIIIVPVGEPVRLLEDVRAKVESVDKDGRTVVGKATIPAGWYCLPDGDQEP